MSIRFFSALVLATFAAASGSAGAQVVHKAPINAPVNKTPSTGVNRQSHTCRDSNFPATITQSDGSLLSYPGGTFMRAEVKQTQPGWVSVNCHYGVRYSSELSPVYIVFRTIKGFSANQCTVSGETVTCAR